MKSKLRMRIDQAHPVRRLMAFALIAVFATAGAQESLQGPRFVAASEDVFGHPHDLTLDPDGQYLYVADVNNDAVRVLDPHNLQVLGEFGVGVLDSPHDVEFDREGRLMVADSGNDRIVLYRVDGLEAERVGQISGELGSPEGVAGDTDDNLYVTNAHLNDVIRYKAGSDESTHRFAGGDGYDMRRPHDIELDAEGTVYVADPGNNRIVLFNTALEPVGNIGGSEYGFREPKYLALDGQGRLYIADQHNNVIKIYNRQREFIAAIEKQGDIALNNPEGVEVRGDDIWVSDTYNDRILLYRW